MNFAHTHTEKHAHSASLTHTWHVYRQSIPQRYILNISTCLYISSSQMVHFLTRTTMTKMTPSYQKPQPPNSSRPEVNNRANQEIWGKEGNVQRIFIKININAKLKLPYSTSNIVLDSLRICLTWEKRPIFSSDFWCHICSTATSNIRPHDVMSLLSETSRNLRPLNWTEQPNDDDDDDDDIIHQTVSHTIKNILLYYIPILLTYQWFRRVTFHIM